MKVARFGVYPNLKSFLPLSVDVALAPKLPADRGSAFSPYKVLEREGNE